jgi:predicted sulfurtransferase
MATLNTAFYKFVNLPELTELRARLKDACLSRGLMGTILLSSEGINGFLAGAPESVHEFKAYLEAIPEIGKLEFKDSTSEKNPFTRMLVKLKKEIIPMGLPEINPTEMTGARLTPLELKKWLDEKRDFVLLDTRNDYEVELGTFTAARDLGLRHFRNFAKKLDLLPAEIPDVKEKPVVMFCTGGIRCEKATAYALKTGFREVYQLEGGILKYFEDCKQEHYEGECFVFDHRRAVSSELKPKFDTGTKIPREIHS